MDALRIVPGGNYEGTGRSRGLARGLLVFFGDLNLTGEGMGIGGVAVRDRTCTYFSRSWNDRVDGDAIGRTYTLDTRIGWSHGRHLPSDALDRVRRRRLHAPALPQSLLLRPVLPLRSALGIYSLFETVPPVGEVSGHLRRAGRARGRPGKVHPPVKPGSTVCLLNEVECRVVHCGGPKRGIVPPPPGWEAHGSARSAGLPV